MSKDVSIDVIKKTQKILGKYVKKPPLTEKLLTKPPFRFLHDVVKSVIKDTGFLKGLFSEAELKTENVAEKDAKIAFLNKLINAVKTLTKLELSIKASKIVAGLEPTNTNILLQSIGKAIESKIDSSLYVAQFKSSNEAPKEKKTTTDDKIRSKSKTNVSKDREKKRRDDTQKVKRDSTPMGKINTPKEGKINTPKEGKINTPKEGKINTPKEENKINKKKAERSDLKGKIKKESKVETPKEIPQIEQEVANEQKNVVTIESEKLESNNNTTVLDTDNNDKGIVNLNTTKLDEDINNAKEERKGSATLVRPKSARPKTGDINPITKNAMPNKKHNSEPSEVPAVSKSSQLLRPPSARPPSARPAAPRLQRPDSALELPLGEATLLGAGVSVIVEGADNDDEDTVVVIEQADAESDSQRSPVDGPQLPQDNQGHLVEQILEQISDKEMAGDARKVGVEWETETYTKDGVAKEITQLRVLIQNVTKTVSPLGKLISYLHEDTDAMYSEMETWTSTRKQLYSEIKKQKRLNEESTKPLLNYLNQLHEEVKKQQQEISEVQNNILRNDLRIKELLLYK